MEIKRTSAFSSSLIWFGAGVSIAEIITGTCFAPLGMGKGIAAVIIGHVIGCVMLFFAGYIGALTRRSAMETTKLSFGIHGSRFFAMLNVLQLTGWTGIMIYDGAQAVNEINAAGPWIWSIVIGALIILWILIGITNLGKINTFAMSALFILTIVMCKVIFSGNGIAAAASETMQFGAAVELAAAMPLSWMPLISDYTKDAEKPFKVTLAGTVTYGIVSCWMYIIGLGAAILTGESNVAAIMVKAGFGIIGLIIIILSTVTTTFLDAYSAGISSETIFHKIKGKPAAAAVAVIGTICAVFFPLDNITDFLYLIGSVFAPMIAIQIADFFILKTDSSSKKVDVMKIVIWAAGFIIYRILMRFNIIVGNTLPDMAITFVICIAAGRISAKKRAVK